MKIIRIIAKFNTERLRKILRDPQPHLQDWWRGWTEAGIDSLTRKFDDPYFYDGGIFKISAREHRAWRQLNRRLMAKNKKLTRAPMLAWVEGKGLFPMIRLLPPKGE